MFDVTDLPIPGVRLLRTQVHKDQRGSFTKIAHDTFFAAAHIRMDFKEQYFSRSVRGVVRGMHFQTPPHDHAKLVTCISGTMLDVVLDLRRNSRTFGKCVDVELSAENGLSIYIPAGCAHGFAAISDEVITLYGVTTIYEANHDMGVRWDSFGFRWPIATPILSARDRLHPKFGDFSSPF